MLNGPQLVQEQKTMKGKLHFLKLKIYHKYPRHIESSMGLIGFLMELTKYGRLKKKSKFNF